MIILRFQYSHRSGSLFDFELLNHVSTNIYKCIAYNILKLRITNMGSVDIVVKILLDKIPTLLCPSTHFTEYY
jgi:hypothetical protein